MTTFHSHTWEHTLLSLAQDTRASVVNPRPAARPIGDKALLARAYAYCDTVTREHSRSFYLATSLLPSDKRRAVRALYAFCRVSDNIVDCPDRNAEKVLRDWRKRSMSVEPPVGDLIATAWIDTRLRYCIPYRYAEQLVEGVARDFRQKRYATFEDLTAYAYGVASTVGLMSLYIIGFSGKQALPYAIKLGVALQITNILRDVGEDWRAGRLYLPSDELAAFGLTEADIAAGRIDDRWRAFMRFQIERNRRLYNEIWPGIAMLNKDGRFAVAAAAELYRAILDDIEAHDYDVFSRRAHVGTLDKLSRLPGIWRRSR